MRLTWFDRLLMRVAPKWWAGRTRARATAQLLARNYDATTSGRRSFGWTRTSGDADAAGVPALAALREFSRDLRRNNGWARRGIQVISNNTVGAMGIDPKPLGGTRQGKRATKLWRDWARTNRCDHDGLLAFKGLQRLAMATIVESGEVLILRRVADSNSGLPVPVKLQLVEPDLIDTAKNNVISGEGNPIRQGIEYDAVGQRVAYWLFPHHPGSARSIFAGQKSARVPASDVIHVFNVERAGQTRGIPWLAAAIARLNDLDGYEDAVLVQQKIAACFSAFVDDPDGTSAAIAEQGDAPNDDLETFEPGHIQYLSPGQSITFATPPAVANQDFSVQALRRIAATIGVTYEDLTNDYSKVNFSSARMGRLAHYANVGDWQQNMLIPQLCDAVWLWVMESAVQVGELLEVPGVEWFPPPRPMMEPEKEGIAIMRLVRSGARTMPSVLRELGVDPEEHIAEIAAFNKRLDALDITLDSDPRSTTASGQIQGTAAAEAAAGDDDKPPEADDEGSDDADDDTDAS